MSPARVPSRVFGAYMNGRASEVRGADCTAATSSGTASVAAPSEEGMAGADHSSVSVLARGVTRVERSTEGAKASTVVAPRAHRAMVEDRGMV